MSLKRKQMVVSVTLALGLNATSIHAQFDAFVDLGSLDSSNGLIINGLASFDFSGISVSAVGDINGDGIDDIAMSSPGVDVGNAGQAGAVYVIFGTEQAISTNFNLETLNGSNGLIINGIRQDDYAGLKVNSAGDMNGDGIDDLVIASKYADPNGLINAGSAYVIFGSNSDFVHPLDLNTLDGNNGFVLNGVEEFERFAHSVSSGGDLNGDGVDDLVIGNNQFNTQDVTASGITYVVFGNDEAGGFPNPFDSDDFDGLNGFMIFGANITDGSGFAVTNAGDINADGLDDLLIGGPFANSTTGLSYVIYGTTNRQPNPFLLSSLNGINGSYINGTDFGDYAGYSVSTVGDFSGDGIDDFILGTRSYTQVGKAYVVFGNDAGLPSTLNLDDIDGDNGLVINGINTGDLMGKSVGLAGDVNGDGLNDIIIGANKASPNGNSEAGSSYVVFGSKNELPAEINLADLNGENGFTINGSTADMESGFSVDSAGDFNADGIVDFIIGAPSFNNERGVSYVVYGNDVIFKDGLD